MAGNKGHRGWGWLRRCSSGRWQASYVGPDKARHNGPHTFTAKMDGEGWLAAERRLIEHWEWTPPATRAVVLNGVKVEEVGAYALYRAYDADDSLLYVGITGNPRERFKVHEAGKEWWSEVARITMERYVTRADVLRAETAAIRRENPKYNVAGVI